LIKSSAEVVMAFSRHPEIVRLRYGIRCVDETSFIFEFFIVLKAQTVGGRLVGLF
jgi:hypothetical protein